MRTYGILPLHGYLSRLLYVQMDSSAFADSYALTPTRKKKEKTASSNSIEPRVNNVVNYIAIVRLIYFRVSVIRFTKKKSILRLKFYGIVMP